MGKSLEDYPEMLTALHISEYLHISRRRVYELFKMDPKHGGIPCIEIGITKRVRKSSFSSWLDKQESNGLVKVN
ncbi:helix-turn-helix domain-containing protein [Cytobacillus kochii]|uniref:helix-turn-helix domain-containing protein n=1 Tax=Cytobacillus kochii TaxID=859143 RepID=UPI00402AC316